MALYKHEFAVCPWCEQKSGRRVDHLYGDRHPVTAGPWYCDECKRPFRVKVNAPGDVELTKDEGNGQSFTRSLALLKFEGKEGPVFFVMDHNRYRSTLTETDEENQDAQRYFFEEGSCPTNWLRECVVVIEDGDTDPHGFLDFVRAVDVPEDFNEDDHQQLPMLFPEAFEGETIDGTVNRPTEIISVRRLS
jgi:hypothetical protein